jgi:hypothetical protein
LISAHQNDIKNNNLKFKKFNLIEFFYPHHFRDVSLHVIFGLHPTFSGKTKEERNALKP